MHYYLLLLLLVGLPIGSGAQDRGVVRRARPQVQVGKRVALVIGNDDYQAPMSGLRNAVNDARDVGAAFERMGYEVIKGYDVTLEESRELRRDFNRAAREAEVAVFFFAGHGVESGGVNYLIPTDARPEVKRDLPDLAFSVSEVLEDLDRTNAAAKLVILDACRNDPLPEGRAAAGGGLAEEKTVSRGTAIIYATDPGSVAQDNPEGNNGLFTASLLKQLERPKLELYSMYQEVLKEVSATSENRQSPWMNTRLGDPLCLFAGPCANQDARLDFRNTTDGSVVTLDGSVARVENSTDNVEISFRIANTLGDGVSVGLEVSSDGGLTWLPNEPRSVRGLQNLLTGPNTLEWDLPGHGELLTRNLIFRVVSRESGSSFPLPLGAGLLAGLALAGVAVWWVRQRGQAPGPTVGPKRAAVSTKKRIFIAYKRSYTPDQEVAAAIRGGLSEDYDVFIDRMMTVGTEWVERIEAEINQSDFVIVLLSENSVTSEMVNAEVELAYRLRQSEGKPMILPVRVAYSEPFAYPLSAYLNKTNWALWESEADTPGLILDLKKAIETGGLSAPDSARLKLKSVSAGEKVAPEPLMSAQPAVEVEGSLEGSMTPDSRYYVTRQADEVAARAAVRIGSTVTIKGPRQMGKSSLLIRLAARARQAGKRVVFLDFQLFDKRSLQDPDRFYKEFCAWIAMELGVPPNLDEYWGIPIGNIQRATLYVDKYLLRQFEGSLMLAMDEVEKVFESPFKDDFFGMLRSWHNDRAVNANFRRFDLALVTSTEPYQLIANLNQSPFNVGDIIDLGDFDIDQVSELNTRHGSPLSHSGVNELVGLIGGHPYLSSKALYSIAHKHITLQELLTSASEERGLFGDHLRNLYFRMAGNPTMVEGMTQILRSGTLEDEGAFWGLRGAGLVRREGDRFKARCKIYHDYFSSRLGV